MTEKDGGISVVTLLSRVDTPGGVSGPTAEQDGSLAPVLAIRRPRTSRRMSRRWRWATVLLVVTVLIVTSVLAVLGLRAEHRATAAIAERRTELTAAAAALAAARARLSSATDQAGATGRTLRADSSTLKADQADLARAQANVQANGVSIGNLDTCLSDVEQALNAVSLGNQSEATSILGGARPVCGAITSASPS